MTASRALRGDARVATALAERVRAAADKLGYVPDPAARALASQRSSHVALIVPSLTNALFVDLLESAQKVLRDAGYQTLIGISHYDAQEEEQLVREFLLHRPAGLLLTGLEQTPSSQRLIAGQRVPCVHMMEIGAPEQYTVGFSQQDAAAQITRLLVAKGRRRIAFAAAQLDARTRQRLQGWRAALQQQGDYDSALEWLDPAPSSQALGAQMFERIWQTQPRPDAIFFCNDDLAQGALLQALRMGVSVPRDVAVAGFNDLPQSALMVPPLTTVRTPRAEVGRQAAELLLEQLRGEPSQPRALDLGFEVIERQST